jgi:hypothetical protein
MQVKDVKQKADEAYRASYAHQLGQHGLIKKPGTRCFFRPVFGRGKRAQKKDTG